MRSFISRCGINPHIACFLGLTAVLCVAGTTDFFESEPNNSKDTADMAVIFDAGTSTLNGVTTSESDVDYWRIATSLNASAGRARYQLLIRSDSGEHRLTLRGNSQTNGVVDTNSDVAVQEAAPLGDGNTGLVFYGAPQAFVYVEVEPLTPDAGAYRLDLRWEQFAEQDLGVFEPGSIEISTLNQGHNTNTDLWVDAEFSPTSVGNDDSIDPPSQQSRLVRTLSAGPYALILSDSNLAAGRRSPADDGNRNEPVVDFGGTIAAENPSAAPIDLSFSITDVNGTRSFEAQRDEPFEAKWFGFRLGNDPLGLGACCFGDGVCHELYTLDNCITSGGVFLGADSYCAISVCGGSCCLPVGTCMQTNQAGCTVRGGTFSPGVFCGSSYDCAPPSTAIGACCVANVGCHETTEVLCNYVGGTYAGDGTACFARREYTSRPNVAIPDATDQPGTVSDVIAVSDDVEINDVEVGLIVEHPWQGEVEVRLQAPNGNQMTLINQPGPGNVGFLENDFGDVANGRFMVFDDAAPRTYALNYGAPVPQNGPVGLWRPVNRFPVLGDPPSRGDWTLTVIDHRSGNVGRLVAWQLRLGGAPTRACCAGQPRGDSNCDVLLNNFDIECFVVALAGGSEQWSESCGNGSCSFLCVNDINGDGRVNSFDIDSFVDCLANGCE